MSSSPQPHAGPETSRLTADVRDSAPWGWFVAGLAGLALLLSARNPTVVLHPQFWHEDALVFFLQQRTEGLAAILEPYAGYLHLFPRIIAAVASFLPLELTPLVYLAGTFAGWLWVGWLVLTSPLFASFRWSMFAALAWVAVPHGGEIFLNLTNTPWPLAAGLALVLAEGPITHGRGSRLFFVAVAALTGPSSIVLAPVAILRLWDCQRHERRFDRTALLSLSLAAFQLMLVVFSSSRAQLAAGADPVRPLVFMAIEVFPELLGTKASFPSDLALRLAGTAAGLAGLYFATRSAIPAVGMRRRLMQGAGLLAGAGVVIYLAEYGGAPKAFGGGQRYLFVPFALYVWALIAAWSHSPKARLIPTLALVLLFLAIGYHSGKHFTTARYPSVDWPAACRLLRAGQKANIRVAPYATQVTILPAAVAPAR